MFTRSELQVYLNEMLTSWPDPSWNHTYAHPEIIYKQKDEEIFICSGLTKIYRTEIQVHPILYWIQAAMWIRLLERGIGFANMERVDELWHSRIERDSLINHWLDTAECTPLSVADFYKSYNAITEGRLPRALENNEPILQVICMQDEWGCKNYMAKNDVNYFTFAWSIIQ